MKAMPVSEGSASNSLYRASSPPDEAPRPTTRKSSGRDERRAALRPGRPLPALRARFLIVMVFGFPHAPSSLSDRAGFDNNTIKSVPPLDRLPAGPARSSSGYDASSNGAAGRRPCAATPGFALASGPGASGLD